MFFYGYMIFNISANKSTLNNKKQIRIQCKLFIHILSIFVYCVELQLRMLTRCGWCCSRGSKWANWWAQQAGDQEESTLGCWCCEDQHEGDQHKVEEELVGHHLCAVSLIELCFRLTLTEPPSHIYTDWSSCAYIIFTQLARFQLLLWSKGVHKVNSRCAKELTQHNFSLHNDNCNNSFSVLNVSVNSRGYFT